MSAEIQNFSLFYYGYIVDNSNFYLNFKEGAGPELTATLSQGEYTFTTLLEEVKRALDDAGALTYTVSGDRDTRLVTISAGSTISLLVSSGTNADTSVFTLIGFNGSDRTGASSYVGDTASGSEYRPQYRLQSYVSTDSWQQAANASVNKTASGRVEVVKFGTEKFAQFSINFVTDIDQGCLGVIRTNPDGVDALRSLMQYLITRGPFEFMPDESETDEFQTLILESDPESSSGTGYRLHELYDKGLPGYYETSILKFRLVED